VSAGVAVSPGGSGQVICTSRRIVVPGAAFQDIQLAEGAA